METTFLSVLVTDVTPLADEELYRRALSLVPAERRAKAERLRFPEDRMRCIGAGLLLRYGLSLRGDRPENHVFAAGEYGKPYFADTDALHFSISHAGDYAMCVLSSFPVGCDIERIPDAERALRIAERFFTREEAAELDGETSLDARAALFARYWTRKESVLKAVGAGFSCPADRFSVREKECVLDGIPGFAGQSCRFRDYAVPDGYRCAVCTVGERGQLPAEIPIQLPDIRRMISVS